MMNRDAGKAAADALGYGDAITSATRYVTEEPVPVTRKSVLGGALPMNTWRSLILSQLRALKFFIFDYSDRPLGSVARNRLEESR